MLHDHLCRGYPDCGITLYNNTHAFILYFLVTTSLVGKVLDPGHMISRGMKMLRNIPTPRPSGLQAYNRERWCSARRDITPDFGSDQNHPPPDPSYRRWQICAVVCQPPKLSRRAMVIVVG